MGINLAGVFNSTREYAALLKFIKLNCFWKWVAILWIRFSL